MKRSLALLILLLTLSLLLSCGDSASPPAETTAPPAAETTAPLEPLDIVKDGKAQFVIVRAEEADKDSVEVASRLRKLIMEYTGASPELTTDWIKPGETPDPNTLEILVGRTVYPQSAEALQGLPYGDYVIRAIGNKLVINAWNAEGLARAVTALATEMQAAPEKGNFSLPGDYSVTGNAVEEINTIPLYSDAMTESVYPADKDTHLLSFPKTDISAYEAYLAALEKNGFTRYAQNDLADNRFTTLISETQTVNVGFYARQKETRLTIEPREVLPPTEAENTYETKTTPMFTMIGLESESDLQNGQCLIWQLSDGSYIIVDGGFSNYRDAKMIYNHLRDNAPDPENIVIAAWFIPHNHGDHHGAYFTFCQSYGKAVTTELVVGSFPSTDYIADGGISPNGVSGVESNAKQYLKAQYLTARPGQKLLLRDAEVDVLYTQENLIPQTYTNLNAASLVISLKLGGQCFLVLADAPEITCSFLYTTYGSTLKSDFIQAAHHGYSNGSSADRGTLGVYQSAAAPVVIWPVGDYNYRTVVGGYTYSVYLQTCETTREIVVAGNRVFTVPLPYTPGTSGQTTILN